MTAEKPAAETMWEGRFLTVRKQGNWEYAERQGSIAAAVILATDPEGRLVLVEQYRVPIGRRCIELPAGLVGDETAGESVIDGARRELEEETGYRAGRLEDCGLFYSSPGMTSESFTIIRASDLVRVGEGGGTEEEGIIVHHVAPADVPRFIAEQRAGGLGIDAKILLLLDGVTIAG